MYQYSLTQNCIKYLFIYADFGHKYFLLYSSTYRVFVLRNKFRALKILYILNKCDICTRHQVEQRM